MKKLLILPLALASLLSTAGCIYRVPVQQGNALAPADVEQIKVGMARKQVQYLLGAPMVPPMFNPDRWDYVYYLRKDGEVTDQRKLTVYFQNDRVVRVEK